MEKDYSKKVADFVADFKTWKPEVYIFIHKGLLYAAWANCNTHANEFHTIDDFTEGDPEIEIYKQELTNWKNMIEEGINNGTIKMIFK